MHTKLVTAAVSLTLLSAGWLVSEGARDPYTCPIERDSRWWSGDHALQLAIAKRKIEGRNLLRLWMSRDVSNAEGHSLRARSIREALDEVHTLGRIDPRLAQAADLYVAPRSSVGAGPNMHRAMRGLR